MASCARFTSTTTAADSAPGRPGTLGEPFTAAQSAAVLLFERGYSHRAIAYALNISRASVRERLDGAERRIIAHERREAA